MKPASKCKQQQHIRRCQTQSQANTFLWSLWTSCESRALNTLCMCPTLPNIWATEGLEASTWQTKDNMAVDSRIKAPATTTTPVLRRLFEDNLGKPVPQRLNQSGFKWGKRWQGYGMQWHQLDHMQTICTSLQTENHTKTSSLNFYRPDALPDAQLIVSKHWRQSDLQPAVNIGLFTVYYACINMYT